MRLINQLLIGCMLTAIMGSASADVEVHEYIAQVSGKTGCKMPIDPAHPTHGECWVKKSNYETGTKIVRVGNECHMQTTSLVELKKFNSNGKTTEAPELTTKLEAVKCPS